MPLPRIREETWKQLCPPEVFCEVGSARKFLADTMVELEDFNPLLYAMLWEGMILGKRNTNLMKTSSFDAVLAVSAICRLISAEGTLPVVSQETYDRVMTEFKEDREKFLTKESDRLFDPCFMKAIGACCLNYEVTGYEEESQLVQVTALMVLRMLELQSELAPVS